MVSVETMVKQLRNSVMVRLCGEASHEPPLSRPAATLSPPCGERAGRGVPIWFMAPMRVQILEVPPAHEPPPLPPFGHPLPRGGGEGRGEGAVGRFKGAMHVRSSGSSLLRE